MGSSLGIQQHGNHPDGLNFFAGNPNLENRRAPCRRVSGGKNKVPRRVHHQRRTETAHALQHMGMCAQNQVSTGTLRRLGQLALSGRRLAGEHLPPMKNYRQRVHLRPCARNRGSHAPDVFAGSDAGPVPFRPVVAGNHVTEGKKPDAEAAQLHHLHLFGFAQVFACAHRDNTRCG